MIPILIWASVIFALVIVLAVAYTLIGVFVSLKRGADHLEALAGGLAQVRDDTGPLEVRIDAINSGLAALAPPLLAANGNLAAIRALARGNE